MPARDVEISKFMSLVLRHAPEQAGLTLDANGWTDFAALSEALQQRFGVADADVRRIVAESPKRRFSLEDGRIRAVQGHSLEIDLKLPPVAPPDLLFHGTSAAFLSAILSEGLTKQERQYVHLSTDEETARIVARRRRGAHSILQVSAGSMAAKGMPFYRAENGVWLTDHVPPQFIAVVDRATDA